jgi:rhomboid protease GluP
VNSNQANDQYPGVNPSGDTAGPSNAERGNWVEVTFQGAKPIVAYVLMGLTITVYILQELSLWFFSGIDMPAALGMKSNELILQGQIWRLITPVLLHGSLIHIGVNMYSLYALGPGLENHYGRRRFLILYILAGFAGNVASFMFTSANSLGASSAIFGLLGAYAVFLYQNRELLGEQARRALTNLATVAAINLVIGLSGGIDNWGHIGGLVGGSLFAWLSGPLMAIGGQIPALTLVDRRDLGDALRAGILVGALFVILAAGTILWRL